MRHIILIISLLFSLPGLSQNGNSEDNGIQISVVTPTEMEGLNTAQISKLESKLQQMVSNHGISGEGYFILYPKFEIYDHSVVEGMRNIHILEVELNLTVKEIQTGKIYNSYTQSITGDGYSESKAIDKSISEIKTRGPEIASFLSETKQKIMDYYRANCSQIFNEADNMIKQKRFREAIALLYPVPRETGNSCYNKIQDKLNEAYLGYMNETCEENLVQARQALKENNNQSALESLSKIDPESNCYTKAQELNHQVSVEMGASASYNNNTVSANTSITATETVEEKRSKGIKVIAEAQYRSRHQMEMSKMQE